MAELYLLYGGALPKLLVIDQGSYSTERTVDLTGTPWRVFETATSVVLFAKRDGKTFAKATSKPRSGCNDRTASHHGVPGGPCRPGRAARAPSRRSRRGPLDAVRSPAARRRRTIPRQSPRVPPARPWHAPC